MMKPSQNTNTLFELSLASMMVNLSKAGTKQHQLATCKQNNRVEANVCAYIVIQSSPPSFEIV
jgi:hypothetical protein